jgi:hypothetical protein
LAKLNASGELMSEDEEVIGESEVPDPLHAFSKRRTSKEIRV